MLLTATLWLWQLVCFWQMGLRFHKKAYVVLPAHLAHDLYGARMRERLSEKCKIQLKLTERM